MPENLKTLRRRVRSIRTTKQITRAMEMVSAAKLRRTSQILNAARPYARTLQEMLGHLAESEEAASHPLFVTANPAAPALLVVITSDRGLCGSFNANLVRRADAWIREHEQNAEVYCVGRKGLDHFRRQNATIAGRITDLSGRVDTEAAARLTHELTELFLQGRYSSVYFLYAKYISNVANRPMIEKFLPIEPEGPEQAAGRKESHEGPYFSQVSYIMEPDPPSVFAALVPKYLNSRILILLAETFTSEHAARMMAMNNATSNSEELIDTLTLRLNKLRQNAITKEMLEIVGGAEALGG